MYHWLRNGILSAVIVCAFAVSPTFAKTEQECLNAVEYGTSQIKNNPQDFRGYACRGSAYVYLKKYDLAEKDLNRAVALKPDESGLYIHLASVYRNTQRYDRALSAIRKSISLGNLAQSTYDYELAILNTASRPQECLKRSSEVLKLFPDDASAYYYLAKSQRLLGIVSKDEIEGNLKRALALDPSDEYASAELKWICKFYKPRKSR